MPPHCACQEGTGSSRGLRKPGADPSPRLSHRQQTRNERLALNVGANARKAFQFMLRPWLSRLRGSPIHAPGMSDDGLRCRKVSSNSRAVKCEPARINSPQRHKVRKGGAEITRRTLRPLCVLCASAVNLTSSCTYYAENPTSSSTCSADLLGPCLEGMRASPPMPSCSPRRGRSSP